MRMGEDPLAPVVEQSRRILRGMLEACGVDVDRFDAMADSDIGLGELSETMGKIWTMFARACSIEEEWQKKLEILEQDKEAVYARAYAEAILETGPKSTETAKKNWIVENFDEMGDINTEIIEIKYMKGQAKAARKALEIRCNMLQSMNKLKLTEMERMHIHLNTQGNQ